ncbi:hypothetical protein [Streptomyces sp. NPDC014734]|uniref:hypothetical protein n=1 Tax=Streptomyces sp. NPDC014734 TaxID=3364886 RepID=UPI0036F8BD27
MSALPPPVFDEAQLEPVLNDEGTRAVLRDVTVVVPSDAVLGEGQTMVLHWSPDGASPCPDGFPVPADRKVLVPASVVMATIGTTATLSYEITGNDAAAVSQSLEVTVPQTVGPAPVIKAALVGGLRLSVKAVEEQGHLPVAISMTWAFVEAGQVVTAECAGFLPGEKKEHTEQILDYVVSEQRAKPKKLGAETMSVQAPASFIQKLDQRRGLTVRHSVSFGGTRPAVTGETSVELTA